MVVFFLGSQGATLKFYLEGAKTIQVCLGEDLALNFCCRRGDVFFKGCLISTLQITGVRPAFFPFS